MTDRTAAQLYADRQREARRLLADINRLLAEDQKDQRRHPLDYTYAGSLGHVCEELREIVRFMKGEEG